MWLTSSWAFFSRFLVRANTQHTVLSYWKFNEFHTSRFPHIYSLCLHTCDSKQFTASQHCAVAKGPVRWIQLDYWKLQFDSNGFSLSLMMMIHALCSQPTSTWDLAQRFPTSPKFYRDCMSLRFSYISINIHHSHWSKFPQLFSFVPKQLMPGSDWYPYTADRMASEQTKQKHRRKRDTERNIWEIRESQNKFFSLPSVLQRSRRRRAQKSSAKCFCLLCSCSSGQRQELCFPTLSRSDFVSGDFSPFTFLLGSFKMFSMILLHFFLHHSISLRLSHCWPSHSLAVSPSCYIFKSKNHFFPLLAFIIAHTLCLHLQSSARRAWKFERHLDAKFAVAQLNFTSQLSSTLNTEPLPL